MGYSEVLCHICGVSFNINRIRTEKEPRKAAWSHCTPSFVDSNGWNCTPDSGCKVVRRRRRPRAYRTPSTRDSQWDWSGDFLEPSDDEDPDHEYESSAGDEPLEYDSDDDDERSSQGPESTDDDCDDQETDQHAEEFRQFRDRTFLDLEHEGAKESATAPDKFEDLFVLADEEARSDAPKDLIPHHLAPRRARMSDPIIVPNSLYQHIAGPGCAHQDGYNGHNVTAEEMKACMTLQCLVRKNVYWRPELDDEDFEFCGRFFLSGISDHMPSRDCNWPDVYPPRHRTSSPHAENHFFEPQFAEEIAMPFHPYCFEIWKRASLLRQNHIDIEGLTGWWLNDAGLDSFEKFPRHPAVDDGRSQSWQHHPGNEFLATNPLFMAGLPDILKASIRSSPGFSVRNSPFTYGDAIMRAGNDPFQAIPEELREMVLSRLGSKDIAHLRLASLTFRNLPISLWYGLLRKEMPWLWEAWSDLPYSFWSTITKRELKPRLIGLENRRQALDRYFGYLNDEMPELRQQNAELREYWEQEIAEKAAEVRKPKTPIRLQWANTDWHHLYLQIKRNWKHLKGLQNRKRIWEDCEEIIRRVAKYRDSGLIPVEDVRAMAQASRDKATARRRREEEERRKRDAEEFARAQGGTQQTFSFVYEQTT